LEFLGKRTTLGKRGTVVGKMSGKSREILKREFIMPG